MRDQWRSTRCMVSIAKNRPSSSENAPVAREAAIAAEREAISPAPASIWSVTLPVEMPKRPSQLVAVSSQTLNSPRSCSCARNVLASATVRVTNCVPNALRAPRISSVEAAIVTSDAAAGRLVQRTSAV